MLLAGLPPNILQYTGQLHNREFSSPNVSHAMDGYPWRKIEEVLITEGCLVVEQQCSRE